MSEDLEIWLAGQRRRHWPLVTQDDETPDHFEDLARRSEPHIPYTHLPFLPKWNANSAFTPSSSVDYFCLPESLSEEWLTYRTRWSVFLQINPRLRLAWLLGQISESHDASSWPYAWSTRILDWVRSGFASDRPFDDRHGIDTPGLREVLRRLSEDGWVTWDGVKDRFAWTPAPDDTMRTLLTMIQRVRASALIRLARENPDLDDLAIEALAIVQTAPRVPPDPGDEMHDLPYDARPDPDDDDDDRK